MEFNFISVTVVSVSDAYKANMDVLTTILHTAPETMSRGRSKRVWAVRRSGCGAASLHEFGRASGVPKRAMVQPMRLASA
ncbi:hypothetical protein LCM4577_06945 [Mesorhizobium sp. LCM 4577]|nr:hypothetical protein LCM4576_01560 [Mesorhizobium sp. LCM 4576]OHV70262.1 hypothetical protein LCM4577_06945 [Mesorhizobium sp. LCM 4577]